MPVANTESEPETLPRSFAKCLGLLSTEHEYLATAESVGHHQSDIARKACAYRTTAELRVSVLHQALGRMALAGGALIIGGAVYFSSGKKEAGRSRTQHLPCDCFVSEASGTVDRKDSRFGLPTAQNYVLKYNLKSSCAMTGFVSCCGILCIGASVLRNLLFSHRGVLA